MPTLSFGPERIKPLVSKYPKRKEETKGLPKKRLESLALIFKQDEILIIQPTFSSTWTLPGGNVEYEESPRDTLIRDLHEQLKFTPHFMQLKLVNYISNRDDRGEYIQLIFLISPGLSPELVSLDFNPRKVKKMCFVKATELDGFLDLQTVKALRSHVPILQMADLPYFENGRSIS
jgi:8-oxo-dGTP diphosphatase